MWIKCVILVWLVVLSGMDLKSCRVPLWLLAAGGGGMLIIGVGRCIAGGGDFVEMALGTIPGILLLVVGRLSGAMGYGDGVVLACLGLFAGYGKTILMLLAGLLLAAVCSVILLVLGKVRRRTEIPFLPFLSVAWFLVEVI